MENSNISTYITSQLRAGITTEDITGQLRAAGWDEDTIAQAFQEARATITPAPEAKSVTNQIDQTVSARETAQEERVMAEYQPEIQQTTNDRQVLPEPIKRGRMKTGWLLFTQSLRVIKQNPELMRYVVMSTIFVFIIIAGLFAAYIYDMFNAHILSYATKESDGSESTQITMTGYVVFAIVGYVMTVITYFYAVALSSHVLAIFHAKQTHYREHIGIARKKLPAIFLLAFIVSIVGLILRFIEERVRIVGWIISRLLGAAWSLATTFTTPIIADTDENGLKSVTHSMRLFKQTWGETFTSRVAVGGFALLLYLGVGLPLYIVTAIGLTIAFGAGGWIAATVLFFLGIIILSILQSLATTILNTALYYYAQYGIIPPAYSPELLASVFTKKNKKQKK